VESALRLPRVLALVGGLALVAAFFMPWFGSQGLLLSGQFLDMVLATASPAQLQQFLPGATPGELQLLRVLVDLFPACGALAALGALIGGLTARGRLGADSIVGLGGLAPLLAWAAGITRLPAGAEPEIGLWLLALGSLAILIGLILDVATRSRRRAAR
jgi:hypothetical protein